MDLDPDARARAAVHAAAMNPDDWPELVRQVAIAICEAHIEGIKRCNEIWQDTATTPRRSP